MSGKLACSASNCVNNENGLCTANKIDIMGINSVSSDGTNCDNFAEKGIKNALSNMFNINVTGEFKQIFTKESIEMSPEIKCKAINCIHNVNNTCIASNVYIHGDSAFTKEQTKCETFKKRN
ncbi:DUF1540 domain-containing protein [Haloimpatiens sp. FM7330]|uniref:DUF1540 domain-containing protein n=1 Tax=Haloimpatiens sp. FM7330 TaxID=3298610 RepID=UPI00363BAF1A